MSLPPNDPWGYFQDNGDDSWMTDVDEATVLREGNERLNQVVGVVNRDVNDFTPPPLSSSTQEKVEGDDTSIPALEFILNPFVDRHSRSLGIRERHYRTTMQRRRDVPIRIDMEVEIMLALLRAIDSVLADDKLHSNDRLYFEVASDRLPHIFNGYGLRVRDWQEGNLRVDSLLNDLAKHLNSQEQFQLNDSFQLSITHVLDQPRGAGRPARLRPGNQKVEVFRRLKNHIITVKNGDEMCCARALVTAKAHVDNHPKRRSFREGRRIQFKQAIDLHEEAGVSPGPCGYDELAKFALAPSLLDYQIQMVDAERDNLVVTFGPPRDKQLIVYYANGHFDAIKSLPGFFGQSYVCAHCNKPYNDDDGRHKCIGGNKCMCCFQHDCPDYLEMRKKRQSASKKCNQCLRLFFGEACLGSHLNKGYTGKAANGTSEKSVCATRQKCPTCFFTKRSPRDFKRHKCGYADCPSCERYVNISTHQCYVQKVPTEEEQKLKRKNRRLGPPCKRGAAAGQQTIEANERDSEEEEEDVKPNDDTPSPLHVYFDVEAMQTTGKHEPNLVMAKLEREDAEVKSFTGDTCIEQFLDWLDQLSGFGKYHITVLAHNFKGYDGYFVLQEYHRQNRKVEQLRKGAMLLQLRQGKIRFIDSYSFLPFALATFPDAFGIKEKSKGYFPHLFNIPKHQEYVGELPSKEYYMMESMSVEGRRAFEMWHEDRCAKNYEFHFQEELFAYCKSDVHLLAEGCERFRKLFQEHTRFNPFDSITIASACNRHFRMNHMAENKIASEPLFGWRRQPLQSRASFEWLSWCNHQIQKDKNETLSKEEHVHDYDHPLHKEYIQHARNRGEYKIPESHYCVDGYDVDTNTVYEFQGCFWHGCPRCFPHRNTEHPRHLGCTMEDVYRKTQKKIEYLRDVCGYIVREMWECDWEAFKTGHEEVREYCNALDFVDPLQPRDAFFGGRTETIAMMATVDSQQGEEIRYIDITSLYPYVNKYKRYPVGHPTFHSNVHPSRLSEFFGVVKCCIVPPRRLFFPVLPVRMEGKLMFSLCRTCTLEKMSDPLVNKTYLCEHDDNERWFIGTWCTPEVEKAVDMGYEIKYIYEIWHFKESSDTMFREYIDEWLRIKQEADGWPENVGDDPQKRAQYIEEYFQKEGIRLRPEKIEKNPGLRALAKLMLNSFWGKFGQQSNKAQIREFSDVVELHKFLDSDLYDVRHVGVINDYKGEVRYKYIQPNDPVQPHLNIFVACFTTCWARLHLYEYLLTLQQQVLYMDTDSIIYKWSQGQPQIATGNFLGEMKDELDGDVILTFGSTGPKSYCYETAKKKVECKVKGLSLNSEGSSYVNFRVMMQTIKEELQDPLDHPRETTVVKSHHIVRDASNYGLHTQPQYKKFKIVNTKRVVDRSTGRSFPYGYGIQDVRG